jgi:hypothetical protein
VSLQEKIDELQEANKTAKDEYESPVRFLAVLSYSDEEFCCIFSFGCGILESMATLLFA